MPIVFSISVLKFQQSIFLPRIKFSLKLFSRTSRSQIWQSCRHSMARRPKFFCHNSESFSLSVREDANENKVFQKVHLFPKCSSGHIESSFDKPVGKFFSNARIFFNQCLKTSKNYIFFRGKNFPSNCSIGEVEVSFDNLPKQYS